MSAVTTWRWTAGAFEQAGETGLIDKHADLLEGVVYVMAPQTDAHARAVRVLNRAARSVDEAAYTVGTQAPVRLSDDTEPEPDLWVARGADTGHHPAATDLELVVEVSATTLRHDSGPKLSVYAKYGVPVVWVVDLDGRRVHTYAEPVDGVYTQIATVTGGQLAHTCGLSVDLADLWPTTS
jgi:hypothetical protein